MVAHQSFDATSACHCKTLLLWCFLHIFTLRGGNRNMRKTTPLDRAAPPNQLMANMHRWKFSALAAAAVLCVGLHAGEASALALGRITVQSALGEPLRAEIDVPQITPAEAETLRATAASPEVFRSQGMEFNPLMNALQIQLQRRADGSAVLRVTSDRPVNDPFLDLVLDTTWGTGKIVRSYTLLFDPPALRSAAPTATAAPQITAPAAAAQQRPAPARVATPAAPAVRAPAASRPAPADGVTVKPGDTAGRIANAHRPADVSLDQMLVALMRANPDAFIQGNVNRVRAGSVLQIPDEATAKSVSNTEARQILAAQSRDFNTFRRKLADAAPSATVASAERSASGKVQAQVEDRKPATAAPDKLTLSKGSLKGQKAAEDQLAKDKQASEANARMAELSKNISDLNKVGAASAAGAAPATAPAASTPAAIKAEVPGVPATPTAPQAPASTPEVPAEAASTPEDAASAPDTTASAPAAEASAPAAPAPKVVVPPPPPIEEPSFLDGLMEDPMIPLAGGGLLALLIGYGAYRVVQRRRGAGGVDSSFMESRIQPDSFFGASGGQRIDTANSEMTTGGSSMAYSPSQLDAGGDVDPVAEADVYLAYGRDLQAEEILKEAIRHNPARVSVHVKLGEIYAKRQDRKALEAVAGDVFKLTQGEGPDWARITELGRGLDPENALYQPGGRPGGEVAQPAPAGGFASTVPAAMGAGAAAALPSDLDLDLDLDLPDDALTDAPAAGGFAAAAAASGLAPEMELPSLDDEPETARAPMAEAAPTLDPLGAADDLSIASSGLAPLSSGTPDTNTLEFDLGDLSLDLTAPSTLSTPTPSAPSVSEEITTASAPMGDDDDGEAAAHDDPLATKLALAEEFNAIGDTDGARTLIEEVVAEATGALKTRAQRLLADLG